jgi:hypothetical protein
MAFLVGNMFRRLVVTVSKWDTWASSARFKSCGLAWMGDAILSNNDSTVLQCRRDMMGEVRVDSRNHPNLVNRHSADASKEIDCALKAARKQSGSGQEQVPYAGGAEVKGRRRRPGPFENLQVEQVQK